jgi:hypothetical protein
MIAGVSGVCFRGYRGGGGGGKDMVWNDSFVDLTVIINAHRWCVNDDHSDNSLASLHFALQMDTV